MEYWIVYDTVTGQVLYPGSGSPGVAQSQPLPPGASLLMVPLAAISGGTVDLEPIREGLSGLVDYNCGQFRLRFITSIPGQDTTYAEKEIEAKAWTPDAPPGTCPGIEEEALETGMSVADVVALVLVMANTWRPLNRRVEAKRRGAVVKIAAATNIADMVRASAVDWDALLTPPA